MQKKIIVVNDKMQKGYKYELTEPVGRNFHPDFRPDLTPKEMLELGVFGGKYLTDCQKEFPKSWFIKAKISPKFYDKNLNFFKVKASQSLKEWQKKGWINKEHDPRGWFQWYCRYYMGRRLEKEDARQIKRWVNMKRHIIWLKNACRAHDLFCRPRQSKHCSTGHMIVEQCKIKDF